jgi:N-acetylglucosaminyldiphosphoundecaprenol N-acetyl-beta-D-mannosaminyltransferase
MPGMMATLERPAGAARAPWPDRVNVLGVGVSALSIPLALSQFDAWIAAGAREYVCVADVHAIMQSRWDEGFRAIHNGAGMVTPDGMPLVWLCRLAGRAAVSRVYGPDLLLATCAHSVARGYRHFLYGAAPGVAAALADTLRARFPGLAIVGTHAPPFHDLSAAEAAETAALIEAARPDVVWVGLSTPKQERWMARFRPLLGAPILVGIGAAFDFHSGTKPQAPFWIQRSGFEWLFRLATEPRRLWPRYRKVVPQFLWYLALQQLRLKRFPLPVDVSGASNHADPAPS